VYCAGRDEKRMDCLEGCCYIRDLAKEGKYEAFPVPVTLHCIAQCIVDGDTCSVVCCCCCLVVSFCVVLLPLMKLALSYTCIIGVVTFNPLFKDPKNTHR
jgi:hypothetical protein